jgi:hypothetical protein
MLNVEKAQLLTSSQLNVEKALCTYIIAEQIIHHGNKKCPRMRQIWHQMTEVPGDL